MELLFKTFKDNKKFQYILGIFGIVILTSLVVFFTAAKGYSVNIDGKNYGVVEKKTDFHEIVEELKSKKESISGYKLGDLSNNVNLEKIEKSTDSYLAKDDLREILAECLDWQVKATAITINGEAKIFVADEEDGKQTLELLKKEYISEGDSVDLLDLKIEEAVAYEETSANLSKIVKPEEAVNIIKDGTDELETYKVNKGDTLWDIAHANNMTVTELKEANPQLKRDLLSIGQELKLVKSEPMLHIVTTEKITKEETISYKTTYLNNSSLWRGQTEVKTYGKNGKRKVTYEIVSKNGSEVARKVLDEEILENPVTKEIYRGTKVMVASRGGGGSGELAWPLRGTITSGYGWRRLGFHTGMDIDGVTGDPVFAAENGVVISAGWNGNYGYCIDIDHGDGLLTRYAHLSKISVKMAQQVKRGDLIGKVGNTGRSFGSHLHFEVRINGEHTNPIKYLD